jgi:hypothetical protein
LTLHFSMLCVTNLMLLLSCIPQKQEPVTL